MKDKEMMKRERMTGKGKDEGQGNDEKGKDEGRGNDVKGKDEGRERMRKREGQKWEG